MKRLLLIAFIILATAGSAMAVKISGYVRVSGTGVSGITLTASSGSSTTTNANGYYEFTVASGWSGTITPSKHDWTFSPANKSYSSVTIDQISQDYVATPPFTALSASFAIVSQSCVAWGDYDNDGNLDLVLTGYGNGNYVAKIYHNDGNNVFREINAPLVGVDSGAVAWADYDRDGDLDLALSGIGQGGYVTKIYRNNNGNFADASIAALKASGYSSLAWGDYDNDGDLDLVVAGFESGGRATRIYTNNGSGGFTENTTASIIGVDQCSLAWGDYDNDGYIDLAIAGNSGNGYISRIYRNNGDGTFTDISAELIGVSRCSLAWGDYDCDGRLDLALAGWDGANYICEIYHNNGGGAFIQVSAGLVGVRDCSLAWGDYDNDGYPDLAVAGDTGSGLTSRIYRNDGNGTFTSIDAGLDPLRQCSVAWGDYDNDGRLDLILAGSTGSWYSSKVYRRSGGAVNTVPTAPTGLTASISDNSSFCDITFNWNAASDAETNQNGLSYNIRVGTTPGGNDVFSGMADLTTGLRRVPAIGNAQKRLSWTLKNVQSGVYYWSVQAIDSAFAASQWAPEATVGASRRKISGYVRTSSGTPIQGATISITDGTATTDQYGYYQFTVPDGWTGAATASKTGYLFYPSARYYANINGDQENMNYTAYIIPKTICGYVMTAEGAAFPGVVVSANNGGGSSTTNDNGYYELQVSYGWSGTVTPSKSGYQFDPANRVFTNVTIDQTNCNFTTLPRAKISGFVTTVEGFPVSNVTITADNNGGSTTTDSSGYYEFLMVRGWSGKITPSKTGCLFYPVSTSYTNLTTDQANQSYTAISIPKTICGYIKTADGSALVGVTVTANTGETTVTDSAGFYSLQVPYGWIGTVIPLMAGMVFTPESRDYAGVVIDQIDQDYQGGVLQTATPKLMKDGDVVGYSAIVTAVFPDFFYMEAENRSNGIRVAKTGHGLDIGDKVNVTGAMKTGENDERYIEALYISPDGTGAVKPVAMNNRAVGGGDLASPPFGQSGITGGVGLNNIGLLVKVWGRITYTDPSGTYILITDGSGDPIRINTEGLADVPSTGPISVIGISSLLPGHLPIILPRSRADITPL